MDIRNEIVEFISVSDNNGALLLTGQWGVGKTHLVKDIVKQLNEEKICAMAVVSLFGIDNVSLLHARIKDEYLELSSRLLSRTARKSYRFIWKTVIDASKVIAAAMRDSAKASAASVGISSVFSFDILSLVSIHKTIGVGDNKCSFVIVFDDFERCGVPIKELMGAINEYSENKNIKTIVVADEDKISQPAYSEFKEKLITRTLKLSPDHTETVKSVINSYPENDKSYKEFLIQHKKCLLSAFGHSGYNNLRTLKACLFDFWRVYKAWKKSSIPMDEIDSVLYKFCAMEYEVKKGSYGKSSLGGYGLVVSGDTDDDRAAGRKEIADKYMENTFHYVPVSLAQWVVEGEWDETQFIEDIRQRYAREDISPEMRFINYAPWDLQQEDIDKGMPALVNRAYRGDATCDELIALFRKTHFLKENGIALPCEVDYKKVEKGFDFRQSSIRLGKKTLVKRRTFADKDTIDDAAKALYKKVERMQEKAYAWSNRSLLVDFLRKKGQLSAYDFKNRYIDRFDDELLRSFIDVYTEASNGDKRELCLALIGIDMNNDQYSDPVDKQTSRQNLEKLISAISVLTNGDSDQISVLISKSFVQKLKEKMDQFDM